MAAGFNLTAQLNLRGPSNIASVVADIRKQIGSINADVTLKINPSSIQSATRLNSALASLNKTLTQTATSASSTASAIQRLGSAMRTVNAGGVAKNINAVATASAKMARNMQTVSKQTATASSEMVEFGRVSGLAIRRFAAFSTVTGTVYALSNAINQGVKAYIDYDRQLVKLQQITGESASVLRFLEDRITQLSTSLGVASSDLTEVSSTLAQAGLTARDTERALKALALSALAPSFDDLSSTVEGSIALMRQFGISASDLEKSLGSVNAVAARFAVEAGDLIAAIQRTGGVFASASRGVSEGTDALNEFLAVFTSVRATTRESAETIATGLRTIFTRIQRGDTIDALKSYGISLTDLDGKFIGAYKAVERLSEGLSKLDPRDLRFSNIVEELGGFRQIGKVIPLIQQFATAQDALRVAQEGQGSLAADAAKAQLSLAVQTAKVREEFLALFRDIGKSDSFQTIAKGALSLASGLIKVADSVKGVLPVLGVILAFRGASAITQFASGFSRGVRGASGPAGLGQRIGGRPAFYGGGEVLAFKKGGVVPGVGSGDKVPALLEPGEVVMSNRAVSKYGRGNLVRMNKYAGGGTATLYVDYAQPNSIDTSYLDKGLANIVNTGKQQFLPPGRKGKQETANSIKSFRLYRSIKGSLLEQSLRRAKPVGTTESSVGAFDYNKWPGNVPAFDYMPYGIPADARLSSRGGEDKEAFKQKINTYKENATSADKNRTRFGAVVFEQGQDKNITIELNSGGRIQKFMSGSAGGVKPKPEPFGTGATKFPRRISNAYAKQTEKEETARRFDKLIQTSPINERIMVDQDMGQQIAESMQQPLDREQFAASFRRAVLRDEIVSNISNFAKFVGLPSEDLSVVLPRQLDFGSGSGPIGSRGGRNLLGGAFTTIDPYGSRGAEGWDLGEFGYTKQDEQDLFGFEKLLEEKKKEREKIRKTPTRTFDDGSFSFDLQAYDRASDEYNALNKQIYDIRTKRDTAISAANKAKEKEFASSGRTTLGFGTRFGKAQNPVFYHELTHQLFKGLKAKSADSFDKYKQRVTTLFETDNDGLVDAFDALNAGYSSADVVYGRSYKIDLLGAKQIEEIRKDPISETAKGLSSLIKSGNAAKKASEFRPINPDFNSAMLKFYSQGHLDKVEDNGKEEFLTTLVEKMPVLDQRLQGILDSTMTELLAGAGIQRQQYATGGYVQRFAVGGKNRPKKEIFSSSPTPMLQAILANIEKKPIQKEYSFRSYQEELAGILNQAYKGILMGGTKPVKEKITRDSIVSMYDQYTGTDSYIDVSVGALEDDLKYITGGDPDKRSLKKRKGVEVGDMLDTIRSYQALGLDYTLNTALATGRTSETLGEFQGADLSEIYKTSGLDKVKLSTFVKHMDAAAQYKFPEKLYSGLGDSKLDLILKETNTKNKEDLDNIIGKTFNMPSFLSASDDEALANSFARVGMLTIFTNPKRKGIIPEQSKQTTINRESQAERAKKSRLLQAVEGQKGFAGLSVDESYADAYDSEGEYIFPSNSKFKILSIDKFATNLFDRDAEHRNINMQIQQLEKGGVVQRKLGYIDYDVIANPANEAVVSKGMQEVGVDGPRLYFDKLVEMAVKARKEQSLNKLRAIYGVAGAGKTMLARGQGTDKGTLRETERFPILTPEDIQKATEILLLSSSVSKDKLDTLFADVDRAYTLSSTTPEEKERIQAQRVGRDVTGVGLEGRTPGGTLGVPRDTAVGEALLSDRLGKRSMVLGRTDSGRLRRKRGDELVETVKKRIGMTWGGFAPMTAGHESIIDAAAAMGISPEDFVFLVGSNESIKLGDPSSYRTAIFNQDARVLLAKAGAGARGATVVPKAADFEVPLGVDISEPTGRRKVLLPGEGSTVFVADKTEQQTAKYKEAGYRVSNIERTGGISGTMVRDLIMSGNMAELQKVLSPGVYELISNNIGRIQNRANVLPDIIEQVKQNQGVKLAEVETAIKAVGISRIDQKKMADPEYAAKVQVLEELRSQRDRIKKSAAFEPYRLLDKLAASQPEQYALDFSQSQIVTPAPIRTVKDNAMAAVAAGAASTIQTSSGDTGSGSGSGQSLLDNLADRLKTLGGASGLRELGVGIPLDLQTRLRTNLIKQGVLDTARVTGLIEQGEQRQRERKAKRDGTRHVAMAGLQPLDYSWDPEWELSDGRKYIATIRGFKSSYLQDIERFRDRQKAAALDFAKDTTATEALGLLGQKTVQGVPRSLAIDFDDTLAFGTKMLDSSGKEDISAYYDEARVREVLSRATPTRLAQRLAEIEKDQPGTVRAYTRVLTARAESLKHLVTETLNRFGLPYTDGDITGVGQRGDNDRAIARKKGDNLSAIERFIDDSEKNISAAQQKGIQSYRYSEPKAFENASDYEPFGAGNIEGALLEQTLAMKMGRPIDFEALEQNRALDFPGGLGAAASLFGLPPNIETEVKRTLDKNSFTKARSEFDRYFKENPSKYNVGGLVARFAKGGKPDYYSLEKSSGLSSREFDGMVRYAKTNDFSLDEFKGYLSKRAAQKQSLVGSVTDPKSLQSFLMHGATGARLGTGDLTDEQKKLAEMLKGPPDPQYDPNRFAIGGSVSLYHGANTGVDNSVLKSFQDKGALSGVAQGYGQGAGFYVFSKKARALNQANKRVNDSSMPAQGDRSGKPMVLSFNEVLDPETWDLDYELNKRTVTQWLADNYDRVKDLVQPKITANERLTGIREVHKPGDVLGGRTLENSVLRIQSDMGKRANIEADSDANLNEGMWLGQIMSRLQANDAAAVHAFEQEFFSSISNKDVAIKYVGSSPLRPTNIETFADGGTVPALVSNGEAYVPPKLAKSIGYGKLNRMNQADRNGMGRFSDGGISVFRGPGTGTSDSIRTNLPVGSFILREKATKALGLSGGGTVQKFDGGGTPIPVRPDVVAKATVRIDDNTKNSLETLAQSIKNLGIKSSESQKLLARGGDISYKSAERAMRADIERLRIAGTSSADIIKAEQALAQARSQRKQTLKTQGDLKTLFDAGAGNISDPAVSSNTLLSSKKAKLSVGSLENNPYAVQQAIDMEANALKTRFTKRQQAKGVDTTTEKFQQKASAISYVKATEKVTGVTSKTLENQGVTGGDIERYIKGSLLDRKALAQMDAQYRTIRMAELQAAGKTASEAKKLVEQELKDRRAAANATAKQKGIRGPGGTGVAGAVGRVGLGAYDKVTSFSNRYSQTGMGKFTASMTNNYLAGSAIAALGGQSDNIANLLGGSKERQAGTSAAIQSATSTLGAGLTLATSMAGIPGIGPLAAAATLAGTAFMSVAGAAKAAAEAQKEYENSLKTKKFEDATDSLSKAMDALSKDVSSLELQEAVRNSIRSVVEASAGTTSIAVDTRRKELNDERISSMGMLAYASSYFTENTYLGARPQDNMVLGAADYAKIGRQEAPKNEAANQAALQILEQEFKKSDNSENLLNEIIYSADDVFKSLREAMARAKPETLAKIIQIEEKMAKAKDTATLAELQAKKDSIITESARNNKALENIKKTDELNKAMEAADKAGRTLARTFESMARSVNQAIGRSRFEVDSIEDQMPNNGRLRNRRSRDANILENPNAYSDTERADANKRVANRIYDPNAAGLTAEERKRRQDQADKTEKALGFDSFSFANKLAGAGNQTLDASGNAEFSKVAGAVKAKMEEEIATLPEEMQVQIRKSLSAIEASVDKEGGTEKEKVFLRKVQDELAKSASDAAEAARKMALDVENLVTDALNRLADATNRAVDAQLKAEESYRRARDIRTESDISLRETISGGSIGLGERANIINTRIASMTGGLTDPTQIKDQIGNVVRDDKGNIDLNQSGGLKLKQAQIEEQRDKDLAAATSNSDKMKIEAQATSDLAQLSKQIQSSQSALEELANSTDLATAAMNQLQAVQGMQRDRLQNLDQVLTSSPQELKKFNESLVRVQQRMMGINPSPSKEARRAYNKAFRQSGGNRRIATMAAQEQLAQDRAMDLRTMEQTRSTFVLNQMNQGMSQEAANNAFNQRAAGLRNQMVMESGAANMYGSGVFGAIAASVDPSFDPAGRQAIETKKQADERQAVANEALAKQVAEDSKEILSGASRQLAEVLVELANRIATSDIATQKDLQERTGVVAVKAGGQANGGVVYARLGKLIDFKPQGTDTVPAMLTPGEFVVNAKATAQHLPLLKAINSGSDAIVSKTMSKGGVVYLADGGLLKKDETIEKDRAALDAEVQAQGEAYAAGNEESQRDQAELVQRDQDLHDARLTAYVSDGLAGGDAEYFARFQGSNRNRWNEMTEEERKADTARYQGLIDKERENLYARVNQIESNSGIATTPTREAAMQQIREEDKKKRQEAQDRANEQYQLIEDKKYRSIDWKQTDTDKGEYTKHTGDYTYRTPEQQARYDELARREQLESDRQIAYGEKEVEVSDKGRFVVTGNDYKVIPWKPGEKEAYIQERKNRALANVNAEEQKQGLPITSSAGVSASTGAAQQAEQANKSKEQAQTRAQEVKVAQKQKQQEDPLKQAQQATANQAQTVQGMVAGRMMAIQTGQFNPGEGSPQVRQYAASMGMTVQELQYAQQQQKLARMKPEQRDREIARLQERGKLIAPSALQAEQQKFAAMQQATAQAMQQQSFENKLSSMGEAGRAEYEAAGGKMPDQTSIAMAQKVLDMSGQSAASISEARTESSARSSESAEKQGSLLESTVPKDKKDRYEELEAKRRKGRFNQKDPLTADERKEWTSLYRQRELGAVPTANDNARRLALMGIAPRDRTPEQQEEYLRLRYQLDAYRSSKGQKRTISGATADENFGAFKERVVEEQYARDDKRYDAVSQKDPGSLAEYDRQFVKDYVKQQSDRKNKVLSDMSAQDAAFGSGLQDVEQGLAANEATLADAKSRSAEYKKSKEFQEDQAVIANIENQRQQAQYKQFVSEQMKAGIKDPELLAKDWASQRGLDQIKDLADRQRMLLSYEKEAADFIRSGSAEGGLSDADFSELGERFKEGKELSPQDKRELINQKFAEEQQKKQDEINQRVFGSLAKLDDRASGGNIDKVREQARAYAQAADRLSRIKNVDNQAQIEAFRAKAEELDGLASRFKVSGYGTEDTQAGVSQVQQGLRVSGSQLEQMAADSKLTSVRSDKGIDQYATDKRVAAEQEQARVAAEEARVRAEQQEIERQRRETAEAEQKRKDSMWINSSNPLISGLGYIAGAGEAGGRIVRGGLYAGIGNLASAASGLVGNNTEEAERSRILDAKIKERRAKMAKDGRLVGQGEDQNAALSRLNAELDAQTKAMETASRDAFKGVVDEGAAAGLADVKSVGTLLFDPTNYQESAVGQFNTKQAQTLRDSGQTGLANILDVNNYLTAGVTELLPGLLTGGASGTSGITALGRPLTAVRSTITAPFRGAARATSNYLKIGETVSNIKGIAGEVGGVLGRTRIGRSVADKYSKVRGVVGDAYRGTREVLGEIGDSIIPGRAKAKLAALRKTRAARAKDRDMLSWLDDYAEQKAADNVVSNNYAAAQARRNDPSRIARREKMREQGLIRQKQIQRGRARKAEFEAMSPEERLTARTRRRGRERGVDVDRPAREQAKIRAAEQKAARYNQTRMQGKQTEYGYRLPNKQGKVVYDKAAIARDRLARRAAKRGVNAATANEYVVDFTSTVTNTGNVIRGRTGMGRLDDIIEQRNNAARDKDVLDWLRGKSQTPATSTIDDTSRTSKVLSMVDEQPKSAAQIREDIANQTMKEAIESGRVKVPQPTKSSASGTVPNTASPAGLSNDILARISRGEGYMDGGKFVAGKRPSGSVTQAATPVPTKTPISPSISVTSDKLSRNAERLAKRQKAIADGIDPVTGLKPGAVPPTPPAVPKLATAPAAVIQGDAAVAQRVVQSQKDLAKRLSQYTSSDEAAKRLSTDNVFDIDSVSIDPSMSKTGASGSRQATNALGRFWYNRSGRRHIQVRSADIGSDVIEHELGHAFQANTGKFAGARTKKPTLVDRLLGRRSNNWTGSEIELMEDLGPDIKRFLGNSKGYEALKKSVAEDTTAMYSAKSILDSPLELFTSLVQASRSGKFADNPQAVEMLRKLMKFHGYAKGGIVYANNGALIEARPQGTDTVPAMLTPGEFVVKRDQAQKHMPILQAINKGYYNQGGIVQHLASGGIVAPQYYAAGGVAGMFGAAAGSSRGKDAAVMDIDMAAVQELSKSLDSLKDTFGSLDNVKELGNNLQQAVSNMGQNITAFGEHVSGMPAELLHNISATVTQHVLGIDNAEQRYANQFNSKMDQVAHNHTAQAVHNLHKTTEGAVTNGNTDGIIGKAGGL